MACSVLRMQIHGPALRAIREAKGLTGTEIAKRLEVTQGQVSNWESSRRNPTMANLLALAHLLAVPVAAITIPETVAAA